MDQYIYETSRVTDMSYLFNKSLWECDLSNWDVSNVKNMKGMFSDIEGQSCHPNISGWDVSKVTNMSHMFLGTVFNNFIGDWNVSNVTNMSHMFDCENINPDDYDLTFNKDISKWDVSNVTDVAICFMTIMYLINPLVIGTCPT